MKYHFHNALGNVIDTNRVEAVSEVHEQQKDYYFVVYLESSSEIAISACSYNEVNEAREALIKAVFKHD